MGISEEEQMKAMLAEMGMDSLEELEEDSVTAIDSYRPIPEGPVRREAQSESKEDGQPELENAIESIENEEGKKEEIQVGEKADSENLEFQPQHVTQVNPQHRELSVPALLHLMGLPTASQITVLDTKMDLVLTKMTTLQSKIDRLNSQFEMLSATTATERLEFQVSEIRSIMKKFFPLAFSGGSPQVSSTKLGVVKSPVVVQSSEPTTSSVNSDKKETTVHVAVAPSEVEEEEPLSDEDYQVLQSQKLREQVKKDVK